MIWPIYAVYVCIVGLIRMFKWVEYQFLKLCAVKVKQVWKAQEKKVGIMFRCPGEKWTDEDNKRLLAECARYDKLVHVKVNDEDVFIRWTNLGSLGFGETYMEKMWDYTDSPEDLTEMTKRVLEKKLLQRYYVGWNKLFDWLELFAFNLQTRERAFQVGVVHYDLGNKLYELMLDPWMQYTCGYWKDANNLNDAQLHKMELIAKKLDLKPGMRVLDIGCGWGTLCKYLAEKYKVTCVGVTISKEGVIYGKQINEGLPVDIRLQDYREVDEKFDRIVSVGILEHVGFRNYREFFSLARRCLVDDGIFLMHSIGRNHANFPRSERFSDKYIFPNGNLANPEDIAKATNGLFIIEDWHNFGPDYAKTLYAWRENFIKGWPQIEHQYDEKFYRMWIFYLSMARALFLSRKCQLWQIVFSKDGLKREYRAAR
ncbi:Cyclopropane-fatty-acyl-phospholipid synthase [Pseudolycoriella hygida]|uniref:Cyclopropane-fatty-acyl-phospholipid synthase n=1 Tax=Pseudolycoriella hygida TaxID=35572 RepID=A0A9Q0SA81_9DIPT|nr:Cyclopropane-fatty-acyl-phospholipid synthase [Pseudolycoriella hygida]